MLSTRQVIERIEKHRSQYLFRPGRWFEADQAYQRSVARGMADICIARLEDHPGENPAVILWRLYDQLNHWYDKATTLKEWHWLSVARGTVKDILELIS